VEDSLRRVIKIGNSYYVSLPKHWVKGHSLKEGSLVTLFTRDDGVVEISPLPKEKKIARKIVLKCGKNLGRRIVSAYLYGYDIIEILMESCEPDIVAKEIKRLLTVLTGLEIVEEDLNKITLQCLIRDDYSVTQLIKLMDKLSRGMYLDAIRALIRKDKKIAESVIERDNRVDRLYFLTVRMIRTNLLQGAHVSRDRIFLVDLRLLARDLEEIADVSEIIAKNSIEFIEKNIFSDICLELEKSVKTLSSIQEDIVDAILKRKPLKNTLSKMIYRVEEELEDILEKCATKKHLEYMKVVSLVRMLCSKIVDIEDLLPVI